MSQYIYLFNNILQRTFEPWAMSLIIVSRRYLYWILNGCIFYVCLFSLCRILKYLHNCTVRHKRFLGVLIFDEGYKWKKIILLLQKMYSWNMNLNDRIFLKLFYLKYNIDSKKRHSFNKIFFYNNNFIVWYIKHFKY